MKEIIHKEIVEMVSNNCVGFILETRMKFSVIII